MLECKCPDGLVARDASKLATARTLSRGCPDAPLPEETDPRGLSSWPLCSGQNHCARQQHTRETLREGPPPRKSRDWGANAQPARPIATATAEGQGLTTGWLSLAAGALRGGRRSHSGCGERWPGPLKPAWGAPLRRLDFLRLIFLEATLKGSHRKVREDTNPRKRLNSL